ncbi:MAG: hypothetical protein U1C59_10945 [Methylotenera sp.]|uniref:hypothetical protein n=1 Tax=Methylotenera sp. TaxID=2051956 RepID=UPI0027329E46|nr:hypothetical protein [Methylotenera sp.]MDP3307067.1 hypothetical protein [Methylotenera sp.]MDZ4212216.1 hypothetical protein [Methylotenera sp.]
MFLTLKNSDRIPIVLLVIRHTIFIAMGMWTTDKFLRPDHAAAIFDHYYGLVGVGKNIVYVLATAEAALLIAFLLGLKPRLSYGLVLILHGISTLASYQYQQYLHPFENNNLLFFAAWPMLAACFALYILRDLNTWRICTNLCNCKNKVESNT